MNDFNMKSSDSELSDDDLELQDAFAAGLLKPGLNKVEKKSRTYTNNVKGMQQKLLEIKMDLNWIELLDNINHEAPLAPELAAKMLEQEHKRENQLKNNKKLSQFAPSQDPVLNDFKREMMFHRQAQATVLEALPKLKAKGLKTIRPDDYFAEMAKTDEHMQKIRSALLAKQEGQKRSERVKELRTQRKEGKAMQLQTKLQRHKEKKDMLDQVKKFRKGTSKDMSFLDNKVNRKSVAKRQMKDKKFGFGGQKRGLKMNTKDSASDIAEYRTPGKRGGKFGGTSKKDGKFGGNKGGKVPSKRAGKNKRMQNKNKPRK